MKKESAIKKKPSLNKGQALLVIVLIMAAALTIGLALVSRTVTDIRISLEQEESARAFSAAEAGIEAALGGEPISGLGDFDVVVEEAPLGGTSTFIFPEDVDKGDSKTVWLVNHDDEGNLGTDFFGGSDIRFYWGDESWNGSEEEAPALEAVVIYRAGGEFRTRRVAFAPNADRTEDFTDVNDTNQSLEDETQGITKTFSFNARFSDNDEGANFPAGTDIYALRIKLFFSDNQILGIEAIGDDDLPLQGDCYESTATNRNTGISRKVKQCNLYKAPLAMFDYVLFSEGGLAK
jgi:hypothetical protein